jgi:putative ABC transport system permease protein
VPGVQAFTPFRSTLAYVGAEVQDMFGIDLRTFANASKVSEAFFVGSTAAETLHRLSTTPNGLIVSQETAQGFSLNLGDSLILRMFNVTKHRYVPVHFKLVGVAREFATAPKDAFLVANLAYIQRYTGDPNVDLFLIRTSDSPSAVANTLRAQFANGPLVHVDDLSNVQQKLSTSLTSLNLGALTRIDLFYTFAMFIISLLVFVLAVLLERRRDFAMLQALGTTPAQIRTVLLIEVGYAVVVGSIFGLLVGVGFAELLVQILAAIFDPPPNVMAIPWSSLALAVACMVASGLLAGTIASARLGRLNLAQTLREA